MMQRVLARIRSVWSGLSPGDRRALVLVAAFLALVFGYVCLIEPLLLRHDAASTSLTALIEQEHRYTRQITLLARREAKLAEHRAALEALRSHFKLETATPETRMSRSIAELSYYARLANVHVSVVRPLEAQAVERYVELPLEAEASGSYDALQRFFYYVDTSPSLLAITDLELKADEQGPIQARLKLSAIGRSGQEEPEGSRRRGPHRDGLQLIVSHATGNAPLAVAQAQGYFDTDDLHVDLLALDDSITAERLMLSGEMDGMVVGVPELLNLWVKGLPLKAVLPIAGSAGAEGLVVAKGSTIDSLSQLAGREVAVDTQGSMQLVLMKALEQAHLSLADVKLRALDSGQVERDLIAGTVEIGVTREPYYSSLVMNAHSKSLYSSAALEGLLFELLALTPEALTAKPHLIRQLVAAILKAQQFMNEQPEQAAAIVARWQGQSLTTVRSGLQGLRFYDARRTASFLREQRLGKVLSELATVFESWQQPYPLVTEQDLMAPGFAAEAGVKLE